MGNCFKKQQEICETFSPMSYTPPKYYFNKPISFFSKKYNSYVEIKPKKYFAFE